PSSVTAAGRPCAVAEPTCRCEPRRRHPDQSRRRASLASRGRGELRKLAPDAFDFLAVLLDLGSRGATALEQGPNMDETLELQDEVVDFPLQDRRGHAAASSATAASEPRSSSGSAGFDSIITAASTAPTAAIAART